MRIGSLDAADPLVEVLLAMWFALVPGSSGISGPAPANRPTTTTTDHGGRNRGDPLDPEVAIGRVRRLVEPEHETVCAWRCTMTCGCAAVGQLVDGPLEAGPGGLDVLSIRAVSVMTRPFGRLVSTLVGRC